MTATEVTVDTILTPLLACMVHILHSRSAEVMAASTGSQTMIHNDTFFSCRLRVTINRALWCGHCGRYHLIDRLATSNWHCYMIVYCGWVYDMGRRRRMGRRKLGGDHTYTIAGNFYVALEPRCHRKNETAYAKLCIDFVAPNKTYGARIEAGGFTRNIGARS